MEKSKKHTMEYFAGCSIICLDNIKEHETFLQKRSNNIFIIYLIKIIINIFRGCCINKNKKDIKWLKRNIRFERAPEPEDIIFENIEYANSFKKFIRIFLVYLFSLILIFICFIIVTMFNSLQKYIEEKNNFHIVVAYIISLSICLCISAINFLFKKILDFLTKREKQTTTTNYYLSKSIKLTLFSFMNSGIVPLISEFYISTKGYEYLIINMLMIFLINAFLVPISWTINFSYFYKKFRIWLIERKDDDYSDENEKTQRELNELYELPSMNIAEKHSYIFKTLLISFFYISIFPLGLLISFLGLLLGYHLEKFNFCHMYKRPEMLNDQLCKIYINVFITVLFVSGIGDYIFKYDVYHNSVWSIINIIVFGVLIIIPYQYLINFIIRDYIHLKKYNHDYLQNNQKIFFQVFENMLVENIVVLHK